MNRVLTIFLLLVFSGLGGAQAQTVDCNKVFTKLERAICSNPELDLLDKELDRLSALAIAQNVMTAQGVREMRNSLAWQCGTAERIDECLIVLERREIRQLALQTGELMSPESRGTRRGSDFNRRLKDIRASVLAAERQFEKTGDVDTLVAVTVDLLNGVKSDRQSLPPAVREHEIRALQAKLNKGCNNLGVRRQWHQALQDHGHSCSITVSLGSWAN